jgi:hypothetical protein
MRCVLQKFGDLRAEFGSAGFDTRREEATGK